MRATIPALILLTLLPALPLQAAEPEAPATLESLQAEVERLRGIMPGQAFAMTHTTSTICGSPCRPKTGRSRSST